MKVSDILRVKGSTLYTIHPEQALAEAPDFALAHALRALHEAMYMRRAGVAPAIEAAQRCVVAASERERSHVSVLANLLVVSAALATASRNCSPTG